MPNNVINKVVYGDRTLIDLTDTTADAADVASGKYFYAKDGVKTLGTGSIGGDNGDVYQDAEGYIVLKPGAGTNVSVTPLSVTENGTYSAPTGVAYSPVTVDVNSIVTATATMINIGVDGAIWETVCQVNGEIETSIAIPYDDGDGFDVQVVLSDGENVSRLYADNIYGVHGDATYEDGILTITGDCQIVYEGYTNAVPHFSLLWTQESNWTEHNPVTCDMTFDECVNQTATSNYYAILYEIYEGNEVPISYGLTCQVVEGPPPTYETTLFYRGFRNDQPAFEIEYDNDDTITFTTISSKSSSDLTVSGNTVTAPAGWYGSSASASVPSVVQATPTIAFSSNGLITATAVQTSGYVSAGTKTSTYSLTTRSAADMTVNGSYVTAPSGYYSQAFSKAVDIGSGYVKNGEYYVAGNVNFVSSTGTYNDVFESYRTISAIISQSGYISSITNGSYHIYVSVSGNLPTLSSQTFTPASTNQYISRYQWLTGSQTILGDADLVPSNIRSGVSIFNVEGTMTEGPDVIEVWPETSFTLDATGEAVLPESLKMIPPVGRGIEATVDNVLHHVLMLQTGNDNSTFEYSLYSEENIEEPLLYINLNTNKISSGILTANSTHTVKLEYHLSIEKETLAVLATNQTVSIPFSELGEYYLATPTTNTEISMYSGCELELTINGETHTVGFGNFSVVYATCVVSEATLVPYSGTTYARVRLYNLSTPCTLTYSASIIKYDELVAPHGEIYVPLGKTIDTTYIKYAKAASPYLQFKSVMPSSVSQNIYADTGYDGLDEVYVQGDSNLIASNIRSGVSIFGVSGTMEEGIVDPYYPVYKDLAENKTIRSSAIANDYFNSLSIINAGQFGFAQLSGYFTFNNATEIKQYAFASNYADAKYVNPLATFSFPNVITIWNGAFLSATSIAALHFPKCTTVSSDAFKECTASIYELPLCETLSIRAFQSCYIQSIVLSKCSSIPNSAFYHCDSLSTASFSICTYMGSNAFYGCNKLKEIFASNCTTIGSCAFMYCSSLQSAIFPSCTSMGASAFCYCTGLTTISFDACTVINSSAFYNCSKLYSVSLPSCETIGIAAFFNCYSTSFTSINLPNCTVISANAFSNCYNLSSINFSKVTYLGNSAFCKCSNISIVRLSNCSSIGSYTFQLCWNLSTIYISSPESGTIGAGAFHTCSNLKSVYLTSPYVYSLVGTTAFAYTPISVGQSGLTTTLTFNTVTNLLPSQSTVWASVAAIGASFRGYSGSFKATWNLSSTNYEITNAALLLAFCINGVWSESNWTGGATYSVNGHWWNVLTAYTGTKTFNVSTIPANASQVRIGIYNNATMQSTTATISGSATLSTPSIYGSIYVPASLYASYKTATNWATYSSRFVSLTDAQIAALPF